MGGDGVRGDEACQVYTRDQNATVMNRHTRLSSLTDLFDSR